MCVCQRCWQILAHLQPDSSILGTQRRCRMTKGKGQARKPFKPHSDPKKTQKIWVCSVLKCLEVSKLDENLRKKRATPRAMRRATRRAACLSAKSKVGAQEHQGHLRRATSLSFSSLLQETHGYFFFWSNSLDMFMVHESAYSKNY